MALTTEEKAFYATNGFLLKKKLVPLDWITQVRQELTHIHERMADNPPEGVHVAWEDLSPDQPKRIRQLMHSEVVSPTLNKILRSEAMLDLVAELMAPMDVEHIVDPSRVRAHEVMELAGGRVATTEYSASTGGYTAGPGAPEMSPFTPVPDAGDAWGRTA